MTVPKPDRAFLRHVRMFQRLPDGDLDVLLASLRFRELYAGEVLFEQGDPGDSMFIVCTGSLGAYIRQGTGPEVTLGTSVQGEVLGEMACIDPSPRAATVAAVEDALVGELSRSTLAALRSAAPGLYATLLGSVIQDVTRRLREVESQLADHQKSAAPPPSGMPVDASAAANEPQAEAKERGGFWGFVGRLRGGG